MWRISLVVVQFAAVLQLACSRVRGDRQIPCYFATKMYLHTWIAALSRVIIINSDNSNPIDSLSSLSSHTASAFNRFSRYILIRGLLQFVEIRVPIPTVQSIVGRRWALIVIHPQSERDSLAWIHLRASGSGSRRWLKGDFVVIDISVFLFYASATELSHPQELCLPRY